MVDVRPSPYDLSHYPPSSHRSSPDNTPDNAGAGGVHIAFRHRMARFITVPAPTSRRGASNLPFESHELSLQNSNDHTRDYLQLNSDR